MSRIGNNPINIPENVKVDIQSDKIVVKGKMGELTQNYSDVIFEINNDILIVKRKNDSKDHRAKHGLYRALVNNMVEGVSNGFTKELELVGVGYRASNQGQKLDLSLGFFSQYSI
jgi:large subunit ribosomal protein L6